MSDSSDVTIEETIAYNYEFTLDSGVLRAEIPDDDIGVIWHLYVAPEDRNKGIGTALLERAIAFFKNHDSELDEVHAQIKTSGGATQHLFESHDFDTLSYTKQSNGMEVVDAVKYLNTND